MNTSLASSSRHPVENDDLHSSAEPLLPQQRTSSLNSSNKMTRLAMFRSYYLGAVCCIGGFLFGYDSGVIGGVLTFKSFQSDFNFDEADQTLVFSLCVSLQQLGAFVACFAIWPLTHRYGRKKALMLCSLCFCIGAAMQTINTHSRPAFYVGRIIAGLALGGSTVIVPMYSSEMTPKDIRGQVGSFFQLFYTFGIFTSYWIDYGVAQNIPSTNSHQWQIPIGLQIVPAALLGLGMLTLKESARWLVSKGRNTEALDSLQWIRASSSPATLRELDSIRTAVDHETHARSGFRLVELLDRQNLPRTLTAAAVFTAQQATGATAFAYFAPQYFKLLVGSSPDNENTDLFLTAIFGAVKVAACLLFVLFIAETIGRKRILTYGALFMAACQLATAALLKTNPTSTSSTSLPPSSAATIALIYLFVTAYNFSWGPLPWPYVAEIFGPRTREAGMGLAVAFQWLFNFVFAITTPWMIKRLGWGTFLLWGMFDLVIAGYSWLGLVETRGKSLEEISRGQSGIEERCEEDENRDGHGKRHAVRDREDRDAGR